jgi:hypothetical protein
MVVAPTWSGKCAERLNTPILAIRMPVDGAHGVLITIDSGSTVVVVEEAQRSGLIEAVYNREIVAMFLSDLQDRAEIISVDLASGSLASAAMWHPLL